MTIVTADLGGAISRYTHVMLGIGERRALAPGVRDVAAAAARYQPHFGELAAGDAARAQRLVAQALTTLQPVVVVNRRPAAAAKLLADDSELNTLFTTSKRASGMHAFKAARAVRERLLHVHGDGPTAGRTIYGTVQFVAKHDVTGSLAARPAAGAREYGAAALQLDAASLARTSFSARDSMSGLVAAGDKSQLPSIITERLARSFGFVDDPVVAPVAGTVVEATTVMPQAERQALLLRALALPDDQAVGWLQHQLTSGEIGAGNTYIEAQVRGVAARDVAAVHLEPDYQGVIDPTHKYPGPDVTPADNRALTTAATARGINVYDHRTLPAREIARTA